ncbi:MAG: helix-turn-helix transcriptional regulator [Pseudomonadota bacterium]
MDQMVMQRQQDLAQVAERALRHSGMDSVGLYLFDGALRVVEGVILGMPKAFCDAYEVSGMKIDPVLREMKETGVATSTVTHLGHRWTRSELYRRVSGRFGLAGFAALPLYRNETLSGILYLGTTCEDKQSALDLEGLFTMTPHSARVSTQVMNLPKRRQGLSPRCNDVARLAATGLSNAGIAAQLQTGEAAVRKHLKALNRHFGTTNRTAMAAAWRESDHEGYPFGD